MTKTQLKRFSRIYTDTQFKVGDFVHLRTWTVPPEGPQTPIVAKRPMRIVDSYQDHNGKTVFVCGNRREFEAHNLIPSDWRPR